MAGKYFLVCSLLEICGQNMARLGKNARATTARLASIELLRGKNQQRKTSNGH